MKKYNGRLIGRLKEEFRPKEEKTIDDKIVDVLEELGSTIDPHGYASGDYDTALIQLKELLNK